MEVTIVCGSMTKAAWYMGVKNPRPWYVPDATMAKSPRTALPTSPAQTPRSAMRSRGRSLVKPCSGWLDIDSEYGSFPPRAQGCGAFRRFPWTPGRSVVNLVLGAMRTRGRRSYERRGIRDHDRDLRRPFLAHHPVGPR